MNKFTFSAPKAKNNRKETNHVKTSLSSTTVLNLQMQGTLTCFSELCFKRFLPQDVNALILFWAM